MSKPKNNTKKTSKPDRVCESLEIKKEMRVKLVYLRSISNKAFGFGYFAKSFLCGDRLVLILRNNISERIYHLKTD